MPQSGVTSDDSWYLTSFVILSFYYLPVCLTLLTVQTQINSFLNGEYRRFWVLLFRQRDEACTLWRRRCLGCRFTPMRWFFVPNGSFASYINSTLFRTHMIIARESMICSSLHRGFCGYPIYLGIDGIRICRQALQSGWTQAYIGLLLLHLNFQKNFVGVVHWGNPPSPWVDPCGLTQVFIGLYLLGFTALL